MTNHRKITQKQFNKILKNHEEYLNINRAVIVSVNREERQKCADFSYVDFSNFTNSDIFENVNLDGANFEGAILRDINIINSDFRNVNFNEAQFYNVNFHDVYLFETRFFDCLLENCDFKTDRDSVYGSHCLAAVSFDGAKLDNVYCNYDLDYLDFNNAELKNVVFQECLIRDLEFEDAILDNVDFDQISVHEDSNEINLKNTKLINNSFKTIEELKEILTPSERNEY